MTNVMSSSLGQLGTQLSETVIMTSSTTSVSSEQFKSVNKQLEELKKNRDEDRRENLETKTMFKGIYELLTKKSNEDNSK